MRSRPTLRFDLGDNLSLPFRSLVGPLCAAQALVMAVGYAQAERRGRKRPAKAARKRRLTATAAME